MYLLDIYISICYSLDMSMIEMRNELVKAGYVCSPNNIWSVPGVGMYPSGPGILRLPDLTHEVWVSDRGLDVRNIFGIGQAYFQTPTEFLAWLEIHGVPSEGGLPPYANSFNE
jgi:hypothetical protein